MERTSHYGRIFLVLIAFGIAFPFCFQSSVADDAADKKPKAKDVTKAEAEAKAKEEEMKRGYKWTPHWIEVEGAKKKRKAPHWFDQILESYEKKYKMIAKFHNQVETLNNEVSVYESIEDPKEKRKAAGKIRAAKGKRKRAVRNLQKAVAKEHKPIFVKWEKLARKEAELMRKAKQLEDAGRDSSKQHGDAAQLWGEMEGYGRKLYMLDYFLSPTVGIVEEEGTRRGPGRR